MATLPPGSTQDAAEADKIAADATRTREVYEYWRRRCAALGEDPFGGGATPALAVVRGLPHAPLATLVPERRHLTASTDKLVAESGCCIAAQELADVVGSTGVDGLFTDLGALAAAAVGGGAAPDAKVVARGVRGSREVHDALARLHVTSEHAAANGLDPDETLALYRQETALAFTPSRDSLAMGPLVATGNTCRPTGVHLSLAATRPGWVLVYSHRTETDVLDNDTSRSYDALLRNMLVLGGLDTLVFGHLAADDEMRRVLTLCRANAGFSGAFDTLLRNYRGRLASKKKLPVNVGIGLSQQQLFDELCLGIAMNRVENDVGAPRLLGLLESVAADVTALIDGQSVVTKGSTGFALDDDDAAGVRTVLDAQTRWYGSRADPTTIYARQDRPSDMTGFDRFSHFATYLRFHAGEANFVGFVLRCITQMNQIDALWKSNHSTYGETFRDAFASSTWTKATAASLAKDLANHWATSRVQTNTTWRHVGLTNALIASPDAPGWLTKASAPAPSLLATTKVAARVMDAVRDLKLQSALELALEFTPISKLVDLGVVSSALRVTFANAHSFERMRLVYREVMGAAGWT